jgi:hypothetical protein
MLTRSDPCTRAPSVGMRANADSRMEIMQLPQVPVNDVIRVTTFPSGPSS